MGSIIRGSRGGARRHALASRAVALVVAAALLGGGACVTRTSLPPGVAGILALALSELLDLRSNLETAAADTDARRAASQQAARAARTARATRSAAAPRLEADAANAAAAAAEADAALTGLRERMAVELGVPVSELSARLDARIAELQAQQASGRR